MISDYGIWIMTPDRLSSAINVLEKLTASFQYWRQR